MRIEQFLPLIIGLFASFYTFHFVSPALGVVCLVGSAAAQFLCKLPAPLRRALAELGSGGGSAGRRAGAAAATRPNHAVTKASPAPAHDRKDPVAERHKQRALDLLEQRMTALNGAPAAHIV